MTATNYAVPPGEYLAEWIEEQGLSQQRVADLLGCSRKLVNEVIHGRAPITSDTAILLQRVVGIPAGSWLRYEAAYRSDLARIADEADLARHVDAIAPRAASFLRKCGATKATRKAPGRLVSDFLAFHGCGTWQAYTDLHDASSTSAHALAAAKEANVGIDITELSTWLRAGDLTQEYERGRHYQYDRARLEEQLPRLRERASRPDDTMLQDIAALLGEVGVVFVVVEPAAGFPLHGATRWTAGRVPVIQQASRQGKDGALIWTLFHEIGHVLNDPPGEMRLEFSTNRRHDSAAEADANRFAMDVLFGDAGMKPFDGLTTQRAVTQTAAQVGISPGVAALQMHRLRLVDYSFVSGVSVDVDDTSRPR